MDKRSWDILDGETREWHLNWNWKDVHNFTRSSMVVRNLKLQSQCVLYIEHNMWMLWGVQTKGVMGAKRKDISNNMGNLGVTGALPSGEEWWEKWLERWAGAWLSRMFCTMLKTLDSVSYRKKYGLDVPISLLTVVAEWGAWVSGDLWSGKLIWRQWQQLRKERKYSQTKVYKHIV